MKRNVPNKTSVAEKVKDYISRKPFIANALQREIVNYTALARVIKKEIKTGSIEAIKTAIIREKDNIAKEKELKEEKIFSLLRNTKINLQDKISVIISQKQLDIPHIIAADLGERLVYIVDQTQNYKLKKKNIKVEKDLVALILKSPEEIEDIPGVVAFISQLLASKNINIKHFLSCSTNTTIILEFKDALKAFSLLENYIT